MASTVNIYWTTKNGKRLLIKDMADDHIQNILLLFYREKKRSRALRGIVAEAKKRKLPKNPYKEEYPDAFFEDGIWKVIRGGKKYRIED